MTNSHNSSHQEALTVIQQAVSYLAKWAGIELTKPDDSEAIKIAKENLKSPFDDTAKPLRLLFDSVKLSKGQNKKHYWKPDFIKDNNPIIPYPQLEKSSEDDFKKLKEQIKKEIIFLKDSPQDWENLSLLMLILDKFGSFISFGEADVALVDIAKSTAAVAAVLANNPKETQLSLVAGDLSGIQKFIYTISSGGALKSLRARSFYLELVTEEVVQQLLNQLELPRSNVIYAGGGNLYILAPGTKQTKTIITKVRHQFNQWLLSEFQGKVYLALDSSEPFPASDISTKQFAKHWTKATKGLAKYKSRKFGDRLQDVSRLLRKDYAHTPCQVCHRDDEPNLQPLNEEADAVQACPTCKRMYRLGGELLQVDAIVRSQISESEQTSETGNDVIEFNLPATDELDAVNVCYRLV